MSLSAAFSTAPQANRRCPFQEDVRYPVFTSDMAVGASFPKATAENKQPQWRGYAREVGRAYVELAAYDRYDGLHGTAKPYRPLSRPEAAARVEPGGSS